MNLDTSIVAVACVTTGDSVRDTARGHRLLRRRGPAPVRAGSGVLTIEAVGESLGLRPRHRPRAPVLERGPGRARP